MSAILYVQRIFPLTGILQNRFRFPGLWTGLRVEISGTGKLIFGKGVRIGEGTRIHLASGSRLTLGDGVVTGRNVYLSVGRGQEQSIGDRTSIQDGCRIYGNVTVGRGCIFAPNVFVSTGSHTFDDTAHLPILEQERMAPSSDRPIRLLDDCWIGVNVVLAPGVTIGRGCVIGANAVVTKDLAPYSVAAGVPARVLRTRLDFVPPPRIEAARAADLPYFYDGFELAFGSSDEHICQGNFSLALS